MTSWHVSGLFVDCDWDIASWHVSGLFVDCDWDMASWHVSGLFVDLWERKIGNFQHDCKGAGVCGIVSDLVLFSVPLK